VGIAAQMRLRMQAQAPDSGSASIFRVGSETASRALPGTKPRGSPQPGAGEERAVAVARAVAPPVAGARRERDGIGIVGCGTGAADQSRRNQDTYGRARRGRTDRSRGGLTGPGQLAEAGTRGEDEGIDQAGRANDGSAPRPVGVHGWFNFVGWFVLPLTMSMLYYFLNKLCFVTLLFIEAGSTLL
jgi:hypothetical protein